MNNKSLIESGSKTVFGLLPYVGTLLNEIFFDYRSRVKQDRLNAFVEQIYIYLHNQNLQSIPNELQESEDFGDLFESVIRRVVLTNSSERIIRFRNVITDYISTAAKIDYRDTYLDIIDRINEPQIKILKTHSQITIDVRERLRERNELKDEITRLENKLNNGGVLGPDDLQKDYYDIKHAISSKHFRLELVEKDIEHDRHIRTNSYYGLERGDYLFFIQDLYSKGLLLDLGIGTFDTNPFDKMGITDFGKGFLKFINEDIQTIENSLET